jgi:SAM-dependent methyltransferase
MMDDQATAATGTSAADLVAARKRTDTPGGWLLHLRHLAAYYLAAKTITGRGPVLELGSNLGYGAAFFFGATGYLGIDLNVGDCRLAAREVTGASFVGGDCLRLPIRSGAVGTVLSFQVIEHVDDRRLLAEVCRVLRPDGCLFVTTPNRTLRLLPYQHPWNPEHLREYSYRSLSRVLREYFADVTVFGLMAHDPQILAIERARVRQNPFRVYLRMLRVPEVLVGWIARTADGFSVREQTAHADARAVASASIESFYLDRVVDARRAIDLFAICAGPRTQ